MSRELDLFQKPGLNKLAKVVRAYMCAIGSTFYVSQDEILSLVGTLLNVLKQYTSDHILTEKFGGGVMELLTNLSGSNLLKRLTADNMITIIEICLEIGWRNIFYTHDQLVLSLGEYIRNKSAFTFSALFVRPTEPQSEVRTELLSQLTFPSGESGRKVLDDLERKTKLKNRLVDRAALYFAYQQDVATVMQQGMANIVQMYGLLPKLTQRDVLRYVATIAAVEARSELSAVLQESIVLEELLSWACFTSVERSPLPEAQAVRGGKLWLLNE